MACTGPSMSQIRILLVMSLIPSPYPHGRVLCSCLQLLRRHLRSFVPVFLLAPVISLHIFHGTNKCSFWEADVFFSVNDSANTQQKVISYKKCSALKVSSILLNSLHLGKGS